MKETTTKEIIDHTKGITEMRMTLGHLTTLAAVLAESGFFTNLDKIMITIERVSSKLETACLNLIEG